MAPGMISGSELLITEAATITEMKKTSTALPETEINSVYKYSSRKHPYVHKPYNYKYKWRNIIVYTYMHLVFPYAIYLHFTAITWQTFVFGWLYGLLSGLGITCAAHRYWSHKSFKATVPLRIIMAFAHATTNQNPIYRWVRDHRAHHKFSETDADPHNAKRGFFFSHIGWLLVTKHPDVLEKGKTIDMTDILNDRIAMFQSKYYEIIGNVCCFVIPTVIPWYFFGEDIWVAWYVVACMKFVIISNLTWFVNSFAHVKGMQPYDVNEAGAQHVVLHYLTIGEGWHNYHHAFPWDYASSEFGDKLFNFTTAFIDFFAMIGWAYDRKSVPLDVVKRRVLRCGDGSHRFNKEKEDHYWGWGDKDMVGADDEYAEIYNKH